MLISDISKPIIVTSKTLPVIVFSSQLFRQKLQVKFVLHLFHIQNKIFLTILLLNCEKILHILMHGKITVQRVFNRWTLIFSQ